MNDPRLARAKEIQNSIRQILYHDWDPIGISGYGPDDEYDAYIGSVYRILSTSRSEQELIDLLDRTEHDTIGVASERPDHLRQVAQKLLSINVHLNT
jgi:hypothetical protein